MAPFVSDIRIFMSHVRVRDLFTLFESYNYALLYSWEGKMPESFLTMRICQKLCQLQSIHASLIKEKFASALQESLFNAQFLKNLFNVWSKKPSKKAK